MEEAALSGGLLFEAARVDPGLRFDAEVLAVEVAAGAPGVRVATEERLRAHHLAVVALHLCVCCPDMRTDAVILVLGVGQNEDGVVRAALRAAPAVPAHHALVRHVDALVLGAAVMSACCNGAVAEGDVEVPHLVPATHEPVVHRVPLVCLVLLVLQVVAGLVLVRHRQMTMICRTNLLVQLRHRISRVRA
eukprot:2064491-Rhodomonas_salina.1